MSNLLEKNGEQKMIYYATIDTNILVSAQIKKDSIPDQIIQLALDGTICPLLNDSIIEEYRRILLGNKFDFSTRDIEQLLNGLTSNGRFLKPTPTDEPFEDINDIIFYEITLTGRSTGEAYLVTGNLKDFPKKYFVVSPKEMLDIINKDKETGK